MARLFLHRLTTVTDAIDDDARTVVLCAALLHDIGHGPFSHAFEKVTKDSHEDRTREIVENPETEVHKRLVEHDAKLPEAVASFWQGVKKKAAPRVQGFLKQVVSSQLDADRFDYLLRDSYAAGVNYGEFDHLWLISHLNADTEHSRLYLDSKALLAAEAYIFARYHMYRTVYYHKATRAAEVMLKLLFQRYSTLVSGKSQKDAVQVVPDAPKEVVTAFRSKLDLRQYLRFDDPSMSQFFKACESSRDASLKLLGKGLLNRCYLKAIDATDSSHDAVMMFSRDADRALRKGGYDPEFWLVTDTPNDTPYKMYDPDSEATNTQIYIENHSGKPTEISELSEPIARLRKKYALVRFYFPSNMRAEIDEISKRTLRN